MVVGYVPWLICRWHVHPLPEGMGWVRVLGALFMAAGVPALLDSFVRFALQGLGTPAPIFPTRRLVVSGLYRYVRNPMYVAATTTIFGEGLFFADVRVLAYGICAWAVSHLFILTYEEPTLQRTYGPEYQEFCANVNRWVPRLRPWEQTREKL